MSPEKPAETSVPIHELLARRWSPRALDPDGKVSDDQLRAMLEAARWAPSYGNTQPARFIVGRRDTETFGRILSTLSEKNQSWAHRAGALLIGVAITQNEKGEIRLSEYGLALAAQNLVLQAVAEGLAAHQMAGFNAYAASVEFGLPEHARPLVAIAVGVPTDPEILEDPRKIDRERAERHRLPLSEIALSDWGEPLWAP